MPERNEALQGRVTPIPDRAGTQGAERTCRRCLSKVRAAAMSSRGGKKILYFFIGLG